MPTVFFSYSHKDESFRDELEVHLSALKRQKIIESWHDRKIIAGSLIDDAIDKHIDSAEIILLLISPDFIASDYCYDKEVQKALQRNSQGTARVIPVILRPCDWRELPFGKLLATPTDGRAISLWPNHDQAFLEVVKSVKVALRHLLEKPSRRPTSALIETSNSTELPSETAIEKEADGGRPRSIGQIATRPPQGTGSTTNRDGRRVKSPAQRPGIGIEIGTRFTRIYIKDRGIVLDEPSVIAVDKRTLKVKEVGNAAAELLGRTPGHVVMIRPVAGSIICDPDAASQMLRHFLQTLGVEAGSGAVFSVPAATTEASLKTLYDVAKRAKLGKLEFVPRTLLASAGEDVPASTRLASMVVEIGAGTTDVAVIAESGVYCSCSVRTGGDEITEAITRYTKRAYMLLIGERTADRMKAQIASVMPSDKDLSLEVKGRNIVEGSPKAVTFSDAELRGTIQACVTPIVEAILVARERLPASLFHLVQDDSVLLSGGGALIRGIDKFIQDRIHSRVLVSKDPLHCVVSGFGPLLEGNWNPTSPWAFPRRRLG